MPADRATRRRNGSDPYKQRNIPSHSSSSTHIPPSPIMKMEIDEIIEIPSDDEMEVLDERAQWREGIRRVNRRASDGRAPLRPPRNQTGNVTYVPRQPNPDAPSMRAAQTTRGGYSYDHPLYRVEENVITLKVSDGDRNFVPSDEWRRRKVKDGRVSYYYPVSPDHHIFKRWLEVLGGMLAKHVLDKGPSPGQPNWTLSDFPKGYSLWFHKNGFVADERNARLDPYLHGCRTVHQFRSPMEFAEHIIWLMRGQRGTCACIYCTPGQTQKQITDRLRGRIVERQPRGEEDGEGQVGTRRSGPGRPPHATSRTPQAPYKPIMAKDYRVMPQGQH
ncbi:hypothetical protein BV25DRAFT_1897846 [Artomyces pyxidatus]|uniref:Uncharacterized protein n=1 Tax=Artomyces pyxidatus TaxID=48021 RepID=A0ACB8TCC8_9AGAM|nr:hypothetical protein BV25DRAFT_1897846 [Artomyces pyxidatus]